MKKCTICKESLDLSLFGKDKSRGDGLSSKCKSCAKEVSSRRKDKDPDVYREKQRAAMREYRKNTPKETLLSNWRYERALRRATLKKAVPDWLNGCQKAHIKRTYKLAQLMSECTGSPYHVDHIVPLRGENVCGLHVPWNLKVIPAEINLQKSNSF